MTARKQSIKPTDWVPVIREVGLVIIMVMSGYSIYIGHQNKETVQKIQVQTDGQQEALKLAVAISAESLALSTGLPEHKKKAEEARAAYERHEQIQKEANNK